MKTKITGILLSLTGVALLGVGFSAWAIQSTTPDATSGNVSVTVGEVEDHRMSMTATINSSDDTLKFDAKEDDKTGPIIFSGVKGQGEDLTFKVDIKITNALDSTGTNFSKWFLKSDLKVALTNDKAADYKATIDGNYLVAPIKTEKTLITLPAKFSDNATTGNKENAFYTFKTDISVKSTLVINAEYKFAWGSVFGGKNPCEIEEGAPADTINLYIKALNEKISKLNTSNFIATYSLTKKVA